MANSFLSRVDRSWRFGVPLVLLLLQVGAIVYARSVTARYFCWAPYDTQTAYTAQAIVNGHKLSASEFRKRYRRPEKGADNRSPENLLDMFQEREEKAEKLGDHATIVVTYTVNGKSTQHWRWPLQSAGTPAP